MTSMTFLVMAGGTGGHVYPALGFAELARKRGHKISWLGTAQGLEARVVPENGFELNRIDISGVRGKGKLALLVAPLKILKAVFQALSVLKRVKPDLVIGFGGYSAGPGGLASVLAGIPLVVHEQNAIAGTTNRLLSRIANSVLFAFPGAFSTSLPRFEMVGNPVRAEIINQASSKENDMDRPVRLLVLGGSLGARFLNESVASALSTLPKGQRPQIRHQAGPKLLSEAIESYAGASVEADITAYIEDMAQAYSWADLVVCRAGAMTVSELAVAGVAAILVPFPFAIDDHQSANAQWLVDAGAATIYQQSENDLDLFAGHLIELLQDRARLDAMAQKASQIGIADAADKILTICEGITDVA